MARTVKQNPQGWEYVLTYHEVMSLRAAYRCGYRSPEALQAVAIYNHYRKQIKLMEKGQPYLFKYTNPYNPRHKDKLVRIPEGYVLMPIEPTPAMLKAADKHVMDSSATPYSAYKVMVAVVQEAA